ncbi:hypothetical protein A1O1_08974 [Capronia coronata CBS 617.96]|uniref:Thiol-specific monooxygenase n=1 Tax=Capronia coronata CBS 617.96 TaxID=1182541 RepID=W9XEE5_9EURO|nr:uncharacterized protein A1O1_08974 [Capronia coronata CBS 617.96]EXJ78573.1 hypothetical protein A1O1_08974 [Capronia coronata CBS 617.96]
MRVKARRVAVIGAGPAGAIATDALVKEQAFDTVRVFERKSVAGGTWVYSPELSPSIPSLCALLEQKADQPVTIPTDFPCDTNKTESINSYQIRYSDTGIHENLHSNLPPQTMSFTQEPIPNIISERALAQYGPNAPFRHREVIREWVEEIFNHAGHQDLVEFNTTVEHAEKRGDEWVLTLRKLIPEKKRNHWWQEVFDAVVVATGHFSLPYVPDIPGLVEYDQRFPGTVRHSKHFRSTNEFKGMKVVLVGGSVSAFDALHEIRTVSKRPVIASLREPLPAFGWGAFTHPHVVIKPPIARFHADSGQIDFSDGTSIDHADVVLFATGYDFSFPFLDKSKVEIRNRRIRGLYHHVFSISDPTLSFIGMVAGGLTFRVFEWQAVAVARVLAGRATLPPQEDMERWEAERIAKRGDGVGFFSIAQDLEDSFEELGMLAGEPAAGTTGRVLPKYEQSWIEAFQEIVTLRNRWWAQERLKSEACSNPLVEGKL